MALVLGTNAGFVTTAPTDNPSGGLSTYYLDTRSLAAKFTSPVTAIKITEIGWWCRNATEAANFEVGVYDHNATDNNPENKLWGSAATAKGTTAGWKKKTGLNIEITGETIYWIAVQLDDTSTTTYMDDGSAVGEIFHKKNAQTSLLDPWGVTDDTASNWLLAIYAVYEAAAAGTNIKVNVGDVFKDVSEIKINIGDVWKSVTQAKVNIGDAWKTIYG